jgi:hypothetical protein
MDCTNRRISIVRKIGRDHRINGDSLPEIKRAIVKLAQRMTDLGHSGMIKGDYSEMQIVNAAMCNLLSYEEEQQVAFLLEGGAMFLASIASDTPLDFRSMRRSDYVHPGRRNVNDANRDRKPVGDNPGNPIRRRRKVSPPG